MKQHGKSDADLVNHFIPYVICTSDNMEKEKKSSLGSKAFSPDELLNSIKDRKIANEDRLKLDIDWYITQQIIPPITRLIEHIDGITVDFVAQCLGVDPKKYKYHTSRGDDGEADDSNVMKAIMHG
mmetsp:Transcript_30841/g.22428  ORF Transcript_30841/g.22428 Transcript_30841/m.22428 type:complete len:126 (+) Transcript_30841:1783-2160(+)